MWRDVTWAFLIFLLAAGCWPNLSVTERQLSGGATKAHRCAAVQLQIAPGPDLSPVTGAGPRAVRFTNGGRTCVIRGYPAVRVLDRRGERLPFRIVDSGDQMVTAARPTRFLLPAGGHAWVVLDKYRCDLGDRQAAHTLQLGAAGGAAMESLSSPRIPDWGYCGAHDPGSIIYVSPFEATLLDALADH